MQIRNDPQEVELKLPLASGTSAGGPDRFYSPGPIRTVASGTEVPGPEMEQNHNQQQRWVRKRFRVLLL